MTILSNNIEKRVNEFFSNQISVASYVPIEVTNTTMDSSRLNVVEHEQLHSTVKEEPEITKVKIIDYLNPEEWWTNQMADCKPIEFTNAFNYSMAFYETAISSLSDFIRDDLVDTYPLSYNKSDVFDASVYMV